MGGRATFAGHLGKARVPMQIDVGIGDAVIGASTIEDCPVILDFPAPRLRGYSRETSISEKFHVMIERGRLNSRIKDYFDIWLLARHFEFEGQTLADAIHQTFERRSTVLPEDPGGLQPTFADTPGRTQQWRKFIERNQAEAPDLVRAVAEIRGFLLPVTTAIRNDSPFASRWPAGGPWMS